MQLSKLPYLLLVLLLSFGLEVYAAQEFACKDLEESRGILIKFKSNNSLFRTKNKINSSVNFTNKKLVKKYLHRKLSKKIKKSKRVFEKSKLSSRIKHINPKFANRALRFQKLESQNALDQVYIFEFDFSDNKTALLAASIKTFSSNSNSLEEIIDPDTAFTRTDASFCEEIKTVLQDLNLDANIEYAEPNLKLTINSTNDPYYLSSNTWNQGYDDLWGLKRINADDAWDISQGEGMIVAVIDTGIDFNHPDLWDNIWVNPNFVNDTDDDGDIDIDDLDLDSNKNISNSEITNQALGYNFVSYNNNPRDDQGHGTHVAGTIAAIRNNNLGIVGVAPKAKVFAIKALDSGGSGYISDLADAVVYAAQYADISNNSWGGVGYSATLDQAFQVANNLGMISIAAAGNNSSDAYNFYPAALPTVLAVGSSTQQDLRSSFSNYGSLVDIYAPGGGDSASGSNRNILSTMTALANLGNQVSSGYNRLAGTSMASPHVAGVVALLKAQNPALNKEQIRTVMRNTASPALSVISIPTGIVNAYAALQVPEALPDAKLIFASTNNVSGLIDIKANAKGNNFASYTIDYASGYHGLGSINVSWQNLVSSSNQAQGTLVYKGFDTSSVPDGALTFRLTVTDTNSNIATDFVILTVDNFRLRSPKIETAEYQKAIFTLGDELTINGLIFSNSLIDYDLEVFDKDDNLISIDDLVQISLPLGNSINGKLAAIDVSKLPNPGYYKYNLLANTSFGTELFQGDFIYEPAIKAGWPKAMMQNKPQWICSGSVCSRTQSVFWNNFVLADMNKDLAQDVFQNYTESRFYDDKGILPGWDKHDVYFFSHGHIADVDGDGKLELFGLNRNNFERLTIFEHDGSIKNTLSNYNLGQTILNSANLDNDANQEIVVIANNNYSTQLFVFDENLSIQFNGPYTLVHEYNFSHFKPLIEDIDHDGNKEVIFYFESLNQDNNKIYIVNPKSGEIINSWNVGLITKPLVLTDLDSDNDFEIISFDSATNSIHAYHHDAELVVGFPVVLDSKASYESQLAIGDLNKDAKPEIVISYRVYEAVDDLSFCLTAIQADGTLLEGYPVIKTFDTKDGSEYIGFSTASGFNSPLILDINNDGFNEVIVSKEPLESSRSVIQAYDYQANQVENFEFYGEKDALFISDNSMAIGDIDGDQKLELVFADFDQDLYLYDLDISSTANIEWSMAYGSLDYPGVYLTAAQKLARSQQENHQDENDDNIPQEPVNPSVPPSPTPPSPPPAAPPSPVPPSPPVTPSPTPPDSPDLVPEEPNLEEPAEPIPDEPIPDKPIPDKPLTPFEQSQEILKNNFDKNQDGFLNKKELKKLINKFKQARRISNKGKVLPIDLLHFDLNNDGVVNKSDKELLEGL